MWRKVGGVIVKVHMVYTWGLLTLWLDCHLWNDRTNKPAEAQVSHCHLAPRVMSQAGCWPGNLLEEPSGKWVVAAGMGKWLLRLSLAPSLSL